MSKGNPIVKARVSRSLLAAIEDFVVRYNEKQTCREPIDVSWFVRVACAEKINKAKRGGRKEASPNALQAWRDEQSSGRADEMMA